MSFSQHSLKLLQGLIETYNLKSVKNKCNKRAGRAKYQNPINEQGGAKISKSISEAVLSLDR